MISLSLPNSLITIDNMAFYNCSNLLGQLIIPNNVVTIGRQAFQHCSKLTSLILGNSVQTIDYHAFAFCSQINEEIIMPDSVTKLATYAFIRCESLPSVKLSNNLKEIPESAFSACLSLDNVVIPDSVTTIGIHAFYNCNSLKSIKFSNNLETIGEIAFQYCNFEGPIILPSSIKEIGPNAFNSSKLTEIIYYGTTQPAKCQTAFAGDEITKITAYVTENYTSTTFCGLNTALIMEPTESITETISEVIEITLKSSSEIKNISITCTFSPSSPFTSSLTFSPKRTAFPDGLEKAEVSGQNRRNTASAAAIGVTAGISLVLIIVSAVFIILYLKARSKMLKDNIPEFSDLIDPGTPSETSSYSYSYYVYEYEYSSDDTDD